MKNAPLVSKNREANELRGQADVLRKKLADPATDMSVDEVNKTIEGIRSLEMRAQSVAEFTPQAEIDRQGGEGEEVRSFRADADTAADIAEEEKTKIRKGRKTVAEQIRSLNDEVIGEFGSQHELLRALNGRATPTLSQAKFIDKLQKFTVQVLGGERAITGDNSGQYLLPLTQVAEIFSVSNQQPGIMQTARTYNVPGRSLRIPYLIQDTGDSTLNRPMAGQIADVTIVGEGSTKPTREPQFGQRLLTVYKYAAVTQMGDEILVDDFTGELPTEVSNAVGQQAVNKVNEDCTIDGNGTSQPLGALNAANGALIKVNRATANTFTAPDAFNMYERHTHGPKSCWLISRRVLAQLFALQTTNNTMVTFLRDLNNKPQMLLLGLPVIISDLVAPLGTLGDVSLINGEFYALALRQALTIESSIHFAFTSDLTTYRFIVRAGGLPIPTSTYAYKINASNAKVDEHSPFVTLDLPAS